MKVNESRVPRSKSRKFRRNMTTSTFNQLMRTLCATVIILQLTTAAATVNSNSSNPSTVNSGSSGKKDATATDDSAHYMTLTTTPPSEVVEVITLNSTHAKNETLKAQEQNQFPASQFGGFVPGQSPVPPHLIAALQRRQQLLQAQNGGRPVNALQLLQGFLPGGAGRNIWSSLSPLQRQQLQQQILRNQALQRQLAQRGPGQGLNVNNQNNNRAGNEESNDGGGGGEEDGQGGGQEGQEEPQQNPQDDPDLKQLQGLQGGNNDGFPGDGGSIFEGLFPPGILSQQDIKDIEKGIEEQRKKEEEEKRAKEEEEAREQAAGEEENATQGDNNDQNNINNHQQNGANAQHQGHGHQQQPQQPVNGLVNNAVYPANQYQPQAPAPNAINQNNLPAGPVNPLYPNQPSYPPSSNNGYQNPAPAVVPNFAQIPVHPGGQVNHQNQVNQANQHNYLPGIQQIPGGLYPNSPVQPVSNLPPTQVHQQQPFAPSYPGTGQGPLTPPNQVPQTFQPIPQLTPQQVPGYTPGTVGGYPAVNSLNHQQNRHQQQQPLSPVTPPLQQQPPSSNQYQPPQAPVGQLGPLGQLNPALLNQLNPALLQQYGQQLRNSGLNPLAPGNPLAAQLNPNQLNQLNQLARGFTQGNQPPGAQGPTPPSPFSPFNGLSAFTPGGRGIGSPPLSAGQPGAPNQPSIGSLLRGAGRALGIPGFAAGSNTLSPQGTPYSTESPVPSPSPNYGAIRDNFAEKQPQPYERPRGSYDRDDDRRNTYQPNQGHSDDGDHRSGVDYEDNRRGNIDQRSPYREKYERTRANGQRDRPADKFSSYGRIKDEVRRDRDYGNDYRAGVEYNPNDLNENDRANYNRDTPVRPRNPLYPEDDERRGRGDYPAQRTFRDQMGNQMHRQYNGFGRERDYNRDRGRFDDEDSELHRNRANPFLAG